MKRLLGLALAVFLAGACAPAADEVAVEPAVANRAPTVRVSSPTTVTLPSSARLVATVEDDGQPDSNVVVTWSRVSGPGEVTFESPNAPVTEASFSEPGPYVLLLSANDGETITSQEVTVVASRAPVGTAETQTETATETTTETAAETTEETATETTTETTTEAAEETETAETEPAEAEVTAETTTEAETEAVAETAAPTAAQIEADTTDPEGRATAALSMTDDDFDEAATVPAGGTFFLRIAASDDVGLETLEVQVDRGEGNERLDETPIFPFSRDCDLSTTPREVVCTYTIEVNPSAPPQEYAFRGRIADLANNRASTNYVTVTVTQP